MELNFRQGLISHQLPTFLTASSTPGKIDLNVTPNPLILTIAHGSSDYLFKFDSTILNAWGPLIPGPDNWLYLELNLITGIISYNITVLEPVISLLAPPSIIGQMWFDLNVNTFKVRNNDNTKWIESPRIVVAKVLNGNTSQIQTYPIGSSVGLSVPGHPGNIMVDSALRPLRTSLGEFLTSDTPVRVRTTVGTSGVLTTPTNNFIPVRAEEPIPAMSLVYLSGADSVSLASSNPALTVLKTPIGICERGLALNETGVITQTGEITSDSWDWSADVRKPVYCGFNGELTVTRPLSVQAYRVGHIKNAKSIIFAIDSETTPQIVSAPGAIISGTPPITAVTGLNALSEVVTTISMPAADSTHNGYMTITQVTQLGTFNSRITTNETDILTLQTTKANIAHSHVISDVTGLQTQLNLIPLKADKVVGAVNGNFAALNTAGNLIDSTVSPSTFALAAHVHPISQITGLQSSLDSKAPLVHTHVIADTAGLQASLDGKALLVHTHVISDVIGLQTSLNAKAALVHSHIVSDITGLQTALDNKLNLTDNIPISQVISLQTTLNGKADSIHTHVISDVTGLQTALNGKASLVHTHIAADVTDFSEAVDDRVSSLLVAGSNITLIYADASNQLTISAPTPSLSLSNLSDVSDTLSPVINNVLKYSGTEWVAGSASSISVPGSNTQVLTSDGAGSVTANRVFLSENSASDIQIILGENNSAIPSTGSLITTFAQGDANTRAGTKLTIKSADAIINADGFNAAGGELNLLSGTGGSLIGTNRTGLGGNINIIAGNSNLTNAGNVNITAGVDNGALLDGNITLSAGGSSGTSGHVKIVTNTVERLRILNTGAWLLDGPTATGLVDQVLSSTGSTTSPIWKSLPEDKSVSIIGWRNQFLATTAINIPAAVDGDTYQYALPVSTFKYTPPFDPYNLDPAPSVTLTYTAPTLLLPAGETLLSINSDQGEYLLNISATVVVLPNALDLATDQVNGIVKIHSVSSSVDTDTEWSHSPLFAHDIIPDPAIPSALRSAMLADTVILPFGTYTSSENIRRKDINFTVQLSAISKNVRLFIANAAYSVSGPADVTIEKVIVRVTRLKKTNYFGFP
jgi:Phage tail repeat like